MSLKIYLIRHGETDFNKGNLEWGQKDEISLNDWGILQVDKLSERLKDISFNKIFSSKLKRAVQTSNKLSKLSNQEIIIDDRLKEYEPGGVDPSSEEWKEKYGEMLESGMSKYNIRPFGGDNIWDLIKRVRSFLKDLEKESGTMAIVAHSGVNAVLINLSQRKEKNDFHKIKQDNTCINILNFDEGKWNIESINDAEHTNDLLPKKKIYPNQINIKENIKFHIREKLGEISDKIYIGGDLISNRFGSYDRPHKRHKGSVIVTYALLKDSFQIPRKWKRSLFNKNIQEYEIGSIIIENTKHKIRLVPIKGENNMGQINMEEL